MHGNRCSKSTECAKRPLELDFGFANTIFSSAVGYGFAPFWRTKHFLRTDTLKFKEQTQEFNVKP